MFNCLFNLYPRFLYKTFLVSNLGKSTALVFSLHIHYTYREKSCGCLLCGKPPLFMSQDADVKMVIYRFQRTGLFQLVERKYASLKVNCRLICGFIKDIPNLSYGPLCLEACIINIINCEHHPKSYFFVSSYLSQMNSGDCADYTFLNDELICIKGEAIVFRKHQSSDNTVSSMSLSVHDG